MKTIRQSCCLAALFLVALLGGVSCASIKPLPPADLSQPGWQVRSGQAVWSPGGGRAEMTGDLVFAANRNGDFFVQFLKTPLPIVTAESLHGAWQIEFGANEHHWQGQGRPPQRFAWFQLPGVLAHRPPAGNWHAAVASTNMFTLKNSSTGESLEGQFFP